MGISSTPDVLPKTDPFVKLVWINHLRKGCPGFDWDAKNFFKTIKYNERKTTYANLKTLRKEGHENPFVKIFCRTYF